jgi:hypothetical protein
MIISSGEAYSRGLTRRTPISKFSLGQANYRKPTDVLKTPFDKIASDILKDLILGHKRDLVWIVNVSSLVN